jgi:hypothetical protein
MQPKDENIIARARAVCTYVMLSTGTYVQVQDLIDLFFRRETRALASLFTW